MHALGAGALDDARNVRSVAKYLLERKEEEETFAQALVTFRSALDAWSAPGLRRARSLNRGADRLDHVRFEWDEIWARVSQWPWSSVQFPLDLLQSGEAEC